MIPLEHSGLVISAIFIMLALVSFALLWVVCVIADEWREDDWRPDDLEGKE